MCFGKWISWGSRKRQRRRRKKALAKLAKQQQEREDGSVRGEQKGGTRSPNPGQVNHEVKAASGDHEHVSKKAPVEPAKTLPIYDVRRAGKAPLEVASLLVQANRKPLVPGFRARSIRLGNRYTLSAPATTVTLRQPVNVPRPWTVPHQRRSLVTSISQAVTSSGQQFTDLKPKSDSSAESQFKDVFPKTSASAESKFKDVFPKTSASAESHFKDLFPKTSVSAESQFKDLLLKTFARAESQFMDVFPKTFASAESKFKDVFAKTSASAESQFKDVFPKTSASAESQFKDLLLKTFASAESQFKDTFPKTSASAESQFKDVFPKTSASAESQFKDLFPKTSVSAESQFKGTFPKTSASAESQFKDLLPKTSVSAESQFKDLFPKTSASAESQFKDLLPKTSVSAESQFKDTFPKTSTSAESQFKDLFPKTAFSVEEDGSDSDIKNLRIDQHSFTNQFQTVEVPETQFVFNDCRELLNLTCPSPFLATPIDVTKKTIWGTFYEVKGHLQPCSLRQLLNTDPSRKMFGEDHAKVVAITMVSALEYLHKRGIVHGHLDPGSVHLTPTGFPILMKVERSLRSNGRQLSLEDAALNPDFTAPELLKSRKLFASTGCDAFSLGCLLSWMIQGTTPFQASEGATDLVRDSDWDLGPFYDLSKMSLDAIRVIESYTWTFACQRPGLSVASLHEEKWLKTNNSSEYVDDVLEQKTPSPFWAALEMTRAEE